MTATACTLAVLLMFEAAAPPATTDACELADHRCKAAYFERRSAATTNAEHRAVYLVNAHRLYMRLFALSGDARDLCAAQRTIDASLAVAGQPAPLRARAETMRADILARVKQQDARCEGRSRQRRPRPARAPVVAPRPPPLERVDLPPLLASEALAASDPASTHAPTPASPRSSEALRLAKPDPPTLPPVTTPHLDLTPTTSRPGPGLVIVGGATLVVGTALAVAAGLIGRRMIDTQKQVIALHDRVDRYATHDQVAQDTELRGDFRQQQQQRRALAIGSGATIAVAVILTAVGGRRLARAASRTAFIPAPAGVTFRLRF